MHHSEKFIVLCSTLGIVAVVIAFGSNTALANSLLASITQYQMGAPSMMSSPPSGSNTVPVLGSTVTTPPPTTVGGESGPHDVHGAYIPSPLSFSTPSPNSTVQGIITIKIFGHKQIMNSGGPTVAGMDTSYPLDAINFSIDGQALGKTIVGASDTEIDAAMAARQAAAYANRPTTTGESGPTDATSDGGAFINSFYAEFNRGNTQDGGTCTEGTSQCVYISWDTTRVTNGQHTIGVTGTSAKWTKDASITVTVNNPENNIPVTPPVQNIIPTSNYTASIVCDATAQAVIKAVGGCSKLNPNDSPNAYTACCKVVTKESILKILDSAMQDGVISNDEKSLLLNALDAYLSGGKALTVTPANTTTVTSPATTNGGGSVGTPPCIKKLGVPGGGCNSGSNTGGTVTPPSNCNSNQGTISLNMNAGSSVIIGGYSLARSGNYSFDGDYSYGCYGYNKYGVKKNCANVTVRPCQTTNVLIRWD